MSFVLVHRVTQQLAGRLRHRRELTDQQRVNHYISRMPVAVVTASLGGHPMQAADRYW